MLPAGRPVTAGQLQLAIGRFAAIQPLGLAPVGGFSNLPRNPDGSVQVAALPAALLPLLTPEFLAAMGLTGATGLALYDRLPDRGFEVDDTANDPSGLERSPLRDALVAQAMRANPALAQQDFNRQQAHHIVPRDAGRIDPRYDYLNRVRATLEEYGIGLDSPENGVLLPANAAEQAVMRGPNGGIPYIHSGSHGDYNKYVESLFRNRPPQSREDALQLLNELRGQLENGRIPGQPVTTPGQRLR